MAHRNTEFVSALDRLVEDFCELGLSRPYMATLLEIKAFDLLAQSRELRTIKTTDGEGANHD